MRHYKNIQSSLQNTVFSWPCCTEVPKFKLLSPKQICIYAFFIQLHSELWHYLTYSAHASTGSHVQIYNHSSPSQLYSPYNRRWFPHHRSLLDCTGGTKPLNILMTLEGVELATITSKFWAVMSNMNDVHVKYGLAFVLIAVSIMSN